MIKKESLETARFLCEDELGLYHTVYEYTEFHIIKIAGHTTRQIGMKYLVTDENEKVNKISNKEFVIVNGNKKLRVR